MIRRTLATLLLLVALGATAFVLNAVREKHAKASDASSPAGERGNAVQVVYATWCRACTKLLAPGGEWERLKVELPGVPFAELDETRTEGEAFKRANRMRGLPDVRVVKRTPGVTGPAVSVARYRGRLEAGEMKKWIMARVRVP